MRPSRVITVLVRLHVAARPQNLTFFPFNQRVIVLRRPLFSSSSSAPHSINMQRVLFPRFHLAEIEDQSWCPEFLRTHTHRALARAWKTSTSKNGSAAFQASKILVQELGGLSKTAEFTFIDSCAGAGGPTPIIEPALNKQLSAAGLNNVQFKLTDLWPDLKAWREITSKSENISYVEEPIDATKAIRLSGEKKECRLYNLCFHHFDDPAAEKLLWSAVESSDAFVYVHTDLQSLTFTYL